MKNTSDQHCNEWSVWHWTVLDPHGFVSYRPFTAMLVWSFFSILRTKMFVIIVMYAYFIDISQGSVETH